MSSLHAEEGVATIARDPDNKKVTTVSPTEVRWERTPPAGKSWLVDVQVTIDGKSFACGTGMSGTSTSAEVREQIASICKSIRKR